jgi:hypothetical protein
MIPLSSEPEKSCCPTCLSSLHLQTLSRWKPRLAACIDSHMFFFFGLMDKFLQIFPMLVSGSGPIGSGLIGGRGTQSTACSGFHESGKTGGKSPCCMSTVVVFFFSLSFGTVNSCHAYAF